MSQECQEHKINQINWMEFQTYWICWNCSEQAVSNPGTMKNYSQSSSPSSAFTSARIPSSPGIKNAIHRIFAILLAHTKDSAVLNVGMKSSGSTLPQSPFWKFWLLELLIIVMVLFAVHRTDQRTITSLAATFVHPCKGCLQPNSHYWHYWELRICLFSY